MASLLSGQRSFSMAVTSFTLRRFRGRVIVLCFVAFLLLYIGSNVLYTVEETETRIFHQNKKEPLDKSQYPILIWWTPFTGEPGSIKHCGQVTCFFTEDRKFYNHNRTRGFLFYGSDFKPTDLPIPRKHYHDWALLHEESPKNNFLFTTKEVMELFNHTATFRRQSDLPLTLQYLDSLQSIISKKYFIPTSTKDSMLDELAAVVYVHSDCDTPSDRDSYVRELMNYIKIDSYGKCLHNKDLPDSKLSEPITGMDDEDFWHIMAQYKFSLAFENAVCDDYITEKLWRPIIVGSIPVVYGSQSVKDWLPNSNSAILVTDFASPPDLAQYLNKVNENSTVYESFLDHKLKGEISNELLKKTMEKRKWGINNDFVKGNFIEHFECLVCERISHNMMAEQQGLMPTVHQAHLNHYGCLEPVSPLTGNPDSQSWWLEMHHKAQYEAQALQELLKEGHNFTADQFYGHVIKLLEAQQ